jgi:glycerate kinase
MKTGKPMALVACDKFKGSLDAIQACSAVQRGLGDAWQVDLCPVADGGEGFVATMVAALRGTMVRACCDDPLGREVLADYGIVEQGGQSTAFIEMAAASGLWRIDPAERDIGRASTFGTGQLIVDAIRKHAVSKIIIGLGGSATNDGGAGLAAALGVNFLTARGPLEVVNPRTLRDVVAVDFSRRIALPEIIAACDVDNPLLGPNGASAVYGPQKGATAEDVIWLDEMLGNIVALTNGETQAFTAGAGAAGGLGFGLMRFADARLQPGFELVAAALRLPDRIAAADLVITGEGSLDDQSLSGKGPVAIARLCAEHGKPCVAVAGKVSAAVEKAGIFADVATVAPCGISQEESMARAGELLETAVRDRASRWGMIVRSD